MSEHTPLFGCTIFECAAEISYPEDLLRIFKDELICEECFVEVSASEKDGLWCDLPEFKYHTPLEDELVTALEGVLFAQEGYMYHNEKFTVVAKANNHARALITRAKAT